MSKVSIGLTWGLRAPVPWSWQVPNLSRQEKLTKIPFRNDGGDSGNGRLLFADGCVWTGARHRNPESRVREYL